MITQKGYSDTRFTYDKDRKKVWIEIAIYLQRYIRKDSTILELGSGYCDFINSIIADEKYALDKFINPKEYISNRGHIRLDKNKKWVIARNIIPLFGDFTLMKQIDNNSLDVVFASNFFEHLNEKELESCFSLIKKKLKHKGRLIIIQPNYSLCCKNYFDDYTHVKAWSDISLGDYLEKNNFRILVKKRKFIPFSMKSSLPKSGPLVRIYLRSPIKPFAKQMLFVCENE